LIDQNNKKTAIWRRPKVHTKKVKTDANTDLVSD